MSKRVESLEVACPIRPETHWYSLSVAESIILGISEPIPRPPPQRRTFKRFFTCPTTSQHFSATFEVLEYFRRPIIGVSVEGARDNPDA
jgi:hypothetical protein